MKTVTLLFILSTCYTFGNFSQILPRILRHKRDASGALDIVTNHAQPIHAEVKNDNGGLTDKPCPKRYMGNSPSNIESGTVFQVIPPTDALYTSSARKSLPTSNSLQLVRASSRVITLLTLLISAIIEFYPFVREFYTAVMDYIG